MTDISPVLITGIEDEHFYKIVVAEKIYYLPSPTTKLSIIRKPGLERWIGDVGNRESTRRKIEAAERGTRIHWCHKILLMGGTVVYNPWRNPIYSNDEISRIKAEVGPLVVFVESAEEMYQVAKLRRQFELLRPEVVAVERTVWDLEAKEAGTLDHAYRIKAGSYAINGREPLVLEEGLYVGDLKSGGFDDERHWWYQLAAYSHMLEKQTEQEVKGGLVTFLGAKTKSGIPGLATKFRPRSMLLNRDYRNYRAAAQLWEDEHGDDQPQFYDFPSMITMPKQEVLNEARKESN